MSSFNKFQVYKSFHFSLHAFSQFCCKKLNFLWANIFEHGSKSKRVEFCVTLNLTNLPGKLAFDTLAFISAWTQWHMWEMHKYFKLKQTSPHVTFFRNLKNIMFNITWKHVQMFCTYLLIFMKIYILNLQHVSNHDFPQIPFLYLWMNRTCWERVKWFPVAFSFELNLLFLLD